MSVRNPFRKPTPLEQAASDLIVAQHSLLTAKLTHENAVADVAKYRTRVDRLRSDIAELSTTEEQAA